MTRNRPTADLSTLAGLKATRHSIRAHCLNPHCGSRLLDLDALICQFGPDHVVINDKRISSALVCQNARCPRYGKRGGTITIHPHTWTPPGAVKPLNPP
ncbi:hypothetical protein [Labrenzia sp. CE80]|uniref:hypothetical protein n=1 Tax=Labrenzia sp. CE80 TaxID=1788986 RepID=UPI00257003B3|nr:hypothetical protein [Labrenzia sp. CE80]